MEQLSSGGKRVKRELGRDRRAELSWGKAVKQAIRQRGSISAKCASLEEVSCPFIPFPCTDSEESSWYSFCSAVPLSLCRVTQSNLMSRYLIICRK